MPDSTSRLVAIARGLPRDYESPAPLAAGLGEIGTRLGWGGSARAPFDRVVPPGGRVLIKPNWVLHVNRGTGGLEPLITHASLIRAVVQAVLDSGAGSVLVADAPIQSCDFDRLLEVTGIGEWSRALAGREPRFLGVRDLRRTIRRADASGEVTQTDVQGMDRFALFDLGSASLLEPITTPDHRFRVTQYPPALMARTHGPGRHQFLVARDVLEADLVINLPKLKTHKKGGITCALKNLVGINGNKEYLPHHRIGSPETGGDCYPRADRVKQALEAAFDRYNAASGTTTRRAWRLAARVLESIQHRRGDRLGVEGSWSGNDTVWRMCLDLNRILLYGNADGSMGETPDRRVIHIVDAVISGQGEGPLHSDPLPLGLLLGGASAAAVDQVGATILGFDPRKVPIVREAFAEFLWPLVDFPATAVLALDAKTGASIPAEELEGLTPAGVFYPAGWLDAVRRRP